MQNCKYFVLSEKRSLLSIGCNRIDIVFALYLEQRIKQAERSRGSKLEFQQAFIDWMTFHCQSNIPVFLGGANTENITSCIQISDGEVLAVSSLRNDHEEADDRMMYHLNQSIKYEGSLPLLTQMFSYVLSIILTAGFIVA